MALVALADWDRLRTTLLYDGWLVWPLAWLAHWSVLRAADGLRVGEVESGNVDTKVVTFLRFAHAASAIALVAWVAWEASEWVDRAVPGRHRVGRVRRSVAGNRLSRRDRAGPRGRALAVHRVSEAYATSAGTAIAALLAVWFAIVNMVSPGGAAPLPYAPLANPLDLTLIAALAALFVWVRDTARVAERTLYVWFGLALFLSSTRPCSGQCTSGWRAMACVGRSLRRSRCRPR